MPMKMRLLFFSFFLALPSLQAAQGGSVAIVAYFLLSNDASWVTGQIIGVDGGRSAVA
jgi:NAD(P)-dependent dehydrogenase (short-subunit alcohol dehydrogenase family)